MNTPKSSTAATRSTRLVRLAAVATLLGGAAVGALAQYKIVGPDGKVTYTDKPPTAAQVQPAKGGITAPGTAAGIPYETRQAMAKFPVTLYSTKNCAGCDHARQQLRQRGVPFNEYSVSNESDFSVFRSRFNTTTFPVIAVGSQSIKGFSSNDLTSYLDAAGYPAQAKLAGYSWPPAAPLAPPSANSSTAANEADAPDAAASTPSSLLPPPSKNGIQF